MTNIDDSNTVPPGYWFGEIEARLRERMRDELHELGLRRGGWRVLHTLADGPATADELADRLPRGRRPDPRRGKRPEGKRDDREDRNGRSDERHSSQWHSGEWPAERAGQWHGAPWHGGPDPRMWRDGMPSCADGHGTYHHDGPGGHGRPDGLHDRSGLHDHTRHHDHPGNDRTPADNQPRSHDPHHHDPDIHRHDHPHVERAFERGFVRGFERGMGFGRPRFGRHPFMPFPPHGGRSRRRDGLVGRVLEEFVERGWVWFDGDRATLTEEGRSAHDAAFERVRKVRAAAADGISPEDYAITMAALEKMAGNLGWRPRNGSEDASVKGAGRSADATPETETDGDDERTGTGQADGERG